MNGRSHQPKIPWLIWILQNTQTGCPCPCSWHCIKLIFVWHWDTHKHTHTRKDIHAQPAWTMPYDFRNQNRLTNKPLLSGRTQSNAIPDICLSTHWRALRWNYEMWNECAANLYLQHDTCKYWIHIWFMPRSFWNIFSWYTFRIGQKKCNWKTRIISHTIPSFTLLPSDCVCVCVSGETFMKLF